MPADSNQTQFVTILKSLRKIYLSEDPNESRDYWAQQSVLEAYDKVLAKRIGWKWDAVLEEMSFRNTLTFPNSLEIIDWGCGTGIATRTLIKHLERHQKPLPVKTYLHDRSTLSMNFAKEKITEECPQLTNVIQGLETLATFNQGSEKNVPFRLFLLSHVIGELGTQDLGRLQTILKNFANAIIWVDGGSKALSTKLSQMRDNLKSNFVPLAPCTHSGACPVLETQNASHWCHFFTQAPEGVLADPDWIDIAKEINIDLRSLPYSYLFLLNKKSSQIHHHLSQGHRAIGRPRTYKGYLKIQTCSAEHGLAEFRLQKRDDPKLYKDLSKGRISMPYLWTNKEHDLTPL